MKTALNLFQSIKGIWVIWIGFRSKFWEVAGFEYVTDLDDVKLFRKPK